MGEREKERERLTKKYEEMGIDKAICRPCDYSTACHELSAILRLAYLNLSKNVQSLVLQDILSAFRILPEIQTGYEKSSAKLLLQSAEAVLPKQKKSMVCSQFKQSIVAYKRRSTKSLQHSVTLQLPQDVLIHIFSFLDMQSLVSAGLVCWSWNHAANENAVWKSQYSILFGSCSELSRKKYEFGWKNAFRRHYFYLSYLNVGTPSNRAICMNCQSIIWLSSVTFASPHLCPKLGKHGTRISLISPKKVAEYLLDETELNDFSSDSDDDSDLDEKDEIHRKFFYSVVKEGGCY